MPSTKVIDDVFITQKLEEVFNALVKIKEIACLNNRKNGVKISLWDAYTKELFASSENIFAYIRLQSAAFKKSLGAKVFESFVPVDGISQGTDLELDHDLEINRDIYESKNLFEKDRALLLSRGILTVSRVIGHYVLVKYKAKREHSTGFYHISRFKKLGTQMKNLLLTNPDHKFKSALLIVEEPFKPGEIVWDIHKFIEKQIVMAETLEDNSICLLVKDPQEKNDANSEVRDSKEFKKKIELAQGFDKDKNLISIGDKALLDISIKKLDECMALSGWTIIDDHDGFQFWEDILKTWLFKIVEFQNNRSIVVAKLIETPYIKSLEIGDVLFRFPADALIKVKNDNILDIFHILDRKTKESGTVGHARIWEYRLFSNLRNKIKDKNSFVSETRNPQVYDSVEVQKQRTENIKKQKEAEEKEDKDSGPHDVNRFFGKIIYTVDWPEYEGKRMLCYLVNNELGRVHALYRDGRIEKKVYFRPGLDHISKLRVYSDIVVSDEGQEE